MHLSMLHWLTAAALLTLGGCASTQVAQPKAATVAGKKFDLGGGYETRPRQLTLTINGEPIMKGAFGMYTPSLSLNARYQEIPWTAECYFGSILSGKGGIGGYVASVVQGAPGRSGDTCQIKASGELVETLYF